MSTQPPFHDPSHPYQTSVSNLFSSTPYVFFTSNFKPRKLQVIFLSHIYIYPIAKSHLLNFS